tara:strand:+ start:1248 stop:1508 length:261 start_codon:yes stop_codon:yes gene_type:complete
MSALSILNAVRQRFKAQESTAAATLELYVNKPAAIADHSDIVGEVEKQIRLITEARECLAVIDSVLPNSNESRDPQSFRRDEEPDA